MSKLSLPSAAFLIRVGLIVLGLALFIEQAGARHILGIGFYNGALMATPAYWISLIVPALFLWALWEATGIFVRMDRGDAFGPTMVNGMRRLGWGLMLGAWASSIAAPSLIHVIGNGFVTMVGARFDLSISNITLAVVGLVLILLARRVQALKSNLDAFV